MSHPLDRELAPWLDRAEALIGRRVGDARVHAQAGRMAAAGDRLSEMGMGLERLIGRARVAFLRRAADRRGLAFGPESEAVARTWPILGRTPRDLRRSVDAAARGLIGAAAVADAVALRGWEARQREAVAAEVRSHLSDAQMSMQNVVEWMADEDEDEDEDEGGVTGGEQGQESGRSDQGEVGAPGPEAGGPGREGGREADPGQGQGQGQGPLGLS